MKLPLIYSVLFLYSIASVRVTTDVFIFFVHSIATSAKVLFCFVLFSCTRVMLSSHTHTYWRKSSKGHVQSQYVKGELRRKPRENFVGSQFSTYLLVGASSKIRVLKDTFVHVHMHVNQFCDAWQFISESKNIL